jgi:hypothetical protein
MVSTEVALQTFEDTLQKHSTKVSSKRLEAIVDTIEKLRTQNPAVYDEKTVQRYLVERSRTLKGLVDEYFKASIATQFPMISDQLFALKRYLTFANTGNSWRIVKDDTKAEDTPATVKEGKKIVTKRIEVPLFAYTPLFDGKHTAKLGRFSTTKRISYSRTVVSIEAKLPGSMGSNLKDAYRNALSQYFGVLSEMFTNPVAGDIMYAENNIARPQVGAIWIPTVESLHVTVEQRLIVQRRQIDPAMVLRVKDDFYLVHTWKIDDEKPFEQYLKEFSMGSPKGKK